MSGKLTSVIWKIGCSDHKYVLCSSIYLAFFLSCAGQAARAAVVLVHGFSWHSAYFQELAEALSEAGINAN